jgi:hypothetical protein
LSDASLTSFEINMAILIKKIKVRYVDKISSKL